MEVESSHMTEEEVQDRRLMLFGDGGFGATPIAQPDTQGVRFDRHSLLGKLEVQSNSNVLAP